MGGQPCFLAVSVFRRLRRLAGSCEEHTASLCAFQPRSCGLCEGRRRDSRSSCPLCTIPRVGDSVCALRTAAFFCTSKVAVKSQEASWQALLSQLSFFLDPKSTFPWTSIRTSSCWSAG